MTNVRIPPIADLETAIRLYYSKIELYTDDVKELFPSVKGKSTIAKLKRKAREKMVENGKLSYNANAVNTETAYEAWGLNIKDITSRYEMLKRFKITEIGQRKQ